MAELEESRIQIKKFNTEAGENIMQLICSYRPVSYVSFQYSA